MPSRLVTGAILVFWLAMIGWLIQREVVPMMLADASPTYQPDLTDEIGAPLIGWKIFRDGAPAGSATSRVVRYVDDLETKAEDKAEDDRSFLYRTTFIFNTDAFPVKKMENVHRVGEDGKLMSIRVKIALSKDFQVEVKGSVVNQELEPRFFMNEQEIKEFKLGKIDMSKQGSIINSMNLIGRLRGLRDGQTWKVTNLDLGRFIPKEADMFGDFLKKAAATPDLIAQVRTDAIAWPRKESKQVPCLLIEYHEAGKDVKHRTWVRRSDGLVLKWDLAFLNGNIVLMRVE